MSTEMTSKSDDSVVTLDFTSTEKESEVDVANAPEIADAGTDGGAPVDSSEKDISWKVVVLFAVSNAVIISNMYLNQPLLEVLKDAFGVSTAEIGTIPTFIQIGYVLGLALILPLGDLLPRKTMVISLTAACAIVSLVLPFSHSFPVFQTLNFLLGPILVPIQIFLPAVADLSKPSHVGRNLSWVIMGMMAGMLLSRAVSGAIASASGRWEAAYWAVSAAQALLVVALWVWMPKLERKIRKDTGTTYWQLLKSCVVLFFRHPELRQSSAMAFLCWLSFFNFWTSITYHLAGEPFNYSPGIVGTVGLAGAAAIPFAMGIGYITDRIGAYQTIVLGEILIALAWLISAMFSTSLPPFFISGFLIELALQTQQVPNQKRVFLLDPSARARINSVYMLFAFAGSAAGSGLGARAFAAWGWRGSWAVGVAAAVGAVVIWIVGGKDGSAGWMRTNETFPHLRSAVIHHH